MWISQPIGIEVRRDVTFVDTSRALAKTSLQQRAPVTLAVHPAFSAWKHRELIGETLDSGGWSRCAKWPRIIAPIWLLLTRDRGIQEICQAKVKYLHPVSKLNPVLLIPRTDWILTLTCPNAKWAPER
eukprot:XP_002662584.2 uncharacterized protein si:ch211-239j9.1 [Danio rerio]